MTESPSRDPDRVLRGIDAEITRLTDNRRAPGWTNWAVVVGIGTLLWAMATLHIAFSRSLVELILAMSVGLDAVIGLESIQTSSSAPSGPPRFRSSTTLANARLEHLVLAARGVAIILAARWLAGTWISKDVLEVIWAYGAMSFVGVGLLVLSMVNIPVSPHGTRKLPNVLSSVFVGSTLLILIMAAASYGSVAFASWRSGLFTSDDLQFAGGFVAITFLLGRIVSATNDPIIEVLATTRRDLAFSRIDADTAASQAEIAILGSLYSDFIQKHLSRFITLLEAARGEHDRMEAQLQVLVSTVQPSQSYTGDQLKLIQSVAESCELHLDRIRTITSQIKMVLRAIAFRAAGGPDEDKIEIVKRLSNELDGLEERSKAVTVRLDAARPLFSAVHQAAKAARGSASLAGS